MEIPSSRFGPIQVEADDVIHFPQGLLGLEDCRQWVLLTGADDEAVAWLQSLQRADVALAVVSPRRFVADYRMRIARRELAPLRLDDVDKVEVLAIVGRSAHGVTLNLKAPLLINLERRLGRQVITNGDLPVRHEVKGKQSTLRRSA